MQNIDITNNNGQTPLHIASATCLLKFHADVNVVLIKNHRHTKSKIGNLPIDYARPYPNIVALL